MKMANTFKLKTKVGGSVGANTDMTIYTCPSSTQTTIIGMSIANIASSQITVDVKIESDTSDIETNANVFVITTRLRHSGTLRPITATKNQCCKQQMC